MLRGILTTRTATRGLLPTLLLRTSPKDSVTPAMCTPTTRVQPAASHAFSSCPSVSVPTSSLKSNSSIGTRFISSAQAVAIDEALMGPEHAFSLDQLMELAGLACAQTVQANFPPQTHPRVLVVCGPGNQGGDGLVSARHLLQFGYDVRAWYPKPKSGPLFDRLQTQLASHEVPIVDEFHGAYEQSDVVLDCMFGFSFKGTPRPPFKEAIDLMTATSHANKTRPAVVSVDLPSGWDVDGGNVLGSFVPQVLLSLTAPKAGALHFQGKHWLGGRFVPPALARKFDLRLPLYPAASQIVKITGASSIDDSTDHKL